MQYDQCFPIRTYESLVWEVTYEHGKRQLIVTCKEFNIPKIVELIKIISPNTKFTVGSVTVGTFNLNTTDPIEHSYSGDARMVNQDMEVSV